MKSKVILLTVPALLLGLLPSISSRANVAPGEHLLADHEWDEETRTWMGRAMVAEAGWFGTSDHVAIAYVLYRRWQLTRKAHKRASLIGVIRKYCAGLSETTFNRRQKWVKSLTADARRPAHWPDDIDWRYYRERWQAVLETADQWRRGELPDPCGGISMYFGAPYDRPSKRMIRMDCGETQNFFYTVKPLLDKRSPDVIETGADAPE